MGGFGEFWNSLTQGARDNIIGGLAVAFVVAGVTVFRKSIGAGIRRLFRRTPAPELPQPPSASVPSRQEVVIKFEPPSAPAHKEEPRPAPPPVASHANLPRPTKVPFVARHDQEGNDLLARLRDELSPAKNQLVALWGDGGLGKTALAAEAARTMTDVFKRIVWTSADGRADYSLSTLLDEIATQLGDAELRKLALEPKKEAVHNLIAADPATLIMLDNFETIAPEEQQRCAEWIADHAPCPALITTREQVSAARNIPLGRMSESEANEFLTKLIDQSPTPKTFADIERSRVIEAADANPFVMEWVIAQIELAEHPNDVLNDLARGEGKAAQRVFDRSFNLPQVGDDGRDTLLALSLFVPSASRAALAEVAEFGEDLKRLREAVKHLAALRLLETTEAGERLVLRGLTRSLARARLLKDRRVDKFRRRFITYFVRYARSHAEISKEDFDALEAERENALGAIELAFELAEWEAVMEIRIALEEFLDKRGYWNEAIGYGQQALAAARQSKNDWYIGGFSHNLGCIYSYRGEYDQARQLYDKSLEIAKRLGDQSHIASALHELGRLAQNQGEVEEARRLYNESLEIEKQLRNQSGIALSLHQLAILAQDQGEVEEARHLCNESLGISKQLGNQSGIALSLHQLAMIAQYEGEVEEARRLYSESLE
ncbi:MAG TPA: tetratricopeptide repeat protein, partial [Blastocatellia bacterium]|nr:tetratricopeptide repeat protein [Blastocatellia bacterium]